MLPGDDRSSCQPTSRWRRRRSRWWAPRSRSSDGWTARSTTLGTSIPPVPCMRSTVRPGAATWGSNLTSVFYCMKAEIPAMLESSTGGSIVNNASIAGVAGIAGMSSFAAAKHGVVGLTRSAALECATHGLRVNALVTGNVDTPLYRRLSGVSLDTELDISALNPSGRAARPEEIAAFMTGAAMAIDGGFAAQ